MHLFDKDILIKSDLDKEGQMYFPEVPIFLTRESYQAEREKNKCISLKVRKR